MAVEKCVNDGIVNPLDGDKVKKKLYLQLYTKYKTKLDKDAFRYLNGLIAKLNSRNVIRVSALIMNNILVRMYNQGIHIKESEFFKVQQAVY